MRQIFAIIFLGGVLSATFAVDEPLSPEEIKMILVNSLSPPPQYYDSALVRAESAIKYAVIDTPVVAVVNWVFACDQRKIFRLDSVSVKSVAVFSASDGKWFPVERQDVLSEQNLLDLGKILLYPFFLVRKNFAGYSLSVLKKKVVIDDIECYKVKVKPRKEDNDEESPFYGYFYISDEDHPRPVRFEHRRKSTTGVSLIRWDFAKLDGIDCYFPERVLIGVEAQMCDYDFGAQVRISMGRMEGVSKFNDRGGNAGGTTQ